MGQVSDTNLPTIDGCSVVEPSLEADLSVERDGDTADLFSTNRLDDRA